ncbi:MAG: DUF2142 domain-containing protein [Oscillospiraceae bacterium]|jgi:uncharacterized membrane protein
MGTAVRRDLKQILLIPAAVLLFAAAEIVMYSKFGAGTYFRFYSVMMLTACASVFLALRLSFRGTVPIQYIYLVMGIGFGLVFLFYIPIYMVPDEIVHVNTSYRISDLIMGIDPGSEDTLVMRACDDIQRKAYYTSPDEYAGYFKTMFLPAGDTSLIEVNADYVKNYLDIMYIPSALGITLGRLLGLNGVLTFLMGRLMNLAVFVTATFFSIKIIPRGKFLLMGLALMPMTLQQASSFSYDWFVIGIAFLAFSEMVKLYGTVSHGGSAGTADLIILAVCCLLLLPCKSGAYFPLAVLPLVYVIYRFLRKHPVLRKTVRWIIIAALAAAIGYIVWRSFFATEKLVDEHLNQLPYTDRYGYYKYGYPVEYFINNPGELIVILLRTVWVYFLDYCYTFVGGALGWMNVYLSKWLIVAYAVLLLLGLFYREDGSLVLTGRARAAMIITFFLSVFCVIGGLLLTWTPRTLDVAIGVQGRYFIPVALPMLLAMKPNKKSFKKPGNEVLMTLECTVVLLLTADLMIFQFS